MLGVVALCWRDTSGRAGVAGREQCQSLAQLL